MKCFMIEKITNPLVDFTIEDLVREMDRVYKDVYGDDEKEDDDEDKRSKKEGDDY